MEARRQKSKLAARDRRKTEGEIATDLEQLVPLYSKPPGRHLDRIALVRLAVAFCKLRALSDKNQIFGNNLATTEFSRNVIFPCLDGIVFVLDTSQLILYVSPNVVGCIGINKTDLIGEPLDLFVESDDHAELVEKLNSSNVSAEFNISLRMKSTLTVRGRSLNYKSATNRVMTFSVSRLTTASNAEDKTNKTVYVMYGETIQHPANQDSTAYCISRHSVDWRFSYCQQHLLDHIGLCHKDVISKSLFYYIHPDDLQRFTESVADLSKKGQARTSVYRMVAPTGASIFVQSDATFSCSNRGAKGSYITLIHQILGYCERTDRPITMPVLRQKSSEARKAGVKIKRKQLHSGSDEIVNTPREKNKKMCPKPMAVIKPTPQYTQPTKPFMSPKMELPDHLELPLLHYGGLDTDAYLPLASLMSLANEFGDELLFDQMGWVKSATEVIGMMNPEESAASSAVATTVCKSLNDDLLALTTSGPERVGSPLASLAPFMANHDRTSISPSMTPSSDISLSSCISQDFGRMVLLAPPPNPAPFQSTIEPSQVKQQHQLPASLVDEEINGLTKQIFLENVIQYLKAGAPDEGTGDNCGTMDEVIWETISPGPSTRTSRGNETRRVYDVPTSPGGHV